MENVKNLRNHRCLMQVSQENLFFSHMIESLFAIPAHLAGRAHCDRDVFFFLMDMEKF